MPISSSYSPVIVLAFANDAEVPLRELAVEQDELTEVLEEARKEGKCRIIPLAAASPAKIIQAFQRNRGQVRIFHYSGHSDEQTLFTRQDFPDQSGMQALNLADFLATQTGLELVFINGCLSMEQADAYQQAEVKTVIATDRRIEDRAARKFAELLYRGIAGGATIGEAFREAETGFVIELGEPSSHLRSFDLEEGAEEAESKIPWRIFPKEANDWRLPLVAQHLTRIPSIDLKKEFFGREEDMQRLEEKLKSNSKVVLMNGLGGIGKTVLATAYLQQYGHQYDHLVWINRGEDLIGSIALNEELADTLGLPFEEGEDLDVRFRRILRKLHQLPGHNLLVIDNAQEQVAQQAVLEQLPGPPHWQVLLTSRLRLSGFEALSLGTLAPAAARELFLTHYQGPHSPEALEALLQEIGYHTLTIELLAKLLDKLNELLSLEALTEILQQKELADPDLQEKILSRHSGEEVGIYLHLMKAFELAKLPDEEQWLLKQFVVLPVEPYAVASLADLLQKKPLRLNKTLNSLSSKGWLSQEADKRFSIHRLIQQVADYQLKPQLEEVEELMKSLIQRLDPGPYDNPFSKSVPWLKYAATMEAFFTGKRHSLIAVLQNNIAGAYRDVGQYNQALLFHQKALTSREEILSPDHPHLIQYYNNIAVTYRAIGNLEEALLFHQKVLAIRERGLEANHPHLALSYNNIAVAYYANGNYEKALHFHQKALMIQEEVLDPNHPNLAQSYNNIASVYHAEGKYDKALEFNQKALAIREESLDSNHPDLAQSYNNVALVYYEEGENEKSLKFNQKALQIRKNILAADHPDLAISYHNIAEVYRGMGKYEKAFASHQKAIQIKKNTLGCKHPDLALSYNNLAGIYCANGQYNQALGLLQQARTIWEETSDPNHPDLAQSYNNIAVVYNEIGNYEKAIEFHQKAFAILELIPGSNNLILFRAYQNVAAAYGALGQTDQARIYQQKADSIQQKP